MSFVLSPFRCHRVIASVRPRESTQLLLGRSSPLTVNCLRATIFSVLLYKGFISGSVASRPCKAKKLKSAYAASFRELKSAIRRSCMYSAHVYGGSRSFCQKKSGFSVLFCRLYFAATSGVCLIRSGAAGFQKKPTFAKTKKQNTHTQIETSWPDPSHERGRRRTASAHSHNLVGSCLTAQRLFGCRAARVSFPLPPRVSVGDRHTQKLRAVV